MGQHSLNTVPVGGREPDGLLSSMAEGTDFTGVCHSFCPQGISFLIFFQEGLSFLRGGWGVWSGGHKSGQGEGVSGQGGVRPPEMSTTAVGTHPSGMHSG